jgi:site-specific DNA recombinase
MGTPLQIKPSALASAAAAVPAELFPVAVLARTSTADLQDPRASIRRQIRSCEGWLPAGWFIAAVYWDIESGAIDLEARSQGQAYRAFAEAGIPRDGGMADLLTEAKAPAPKFAAVVCEDIERSGRDTFNALKLEKELSRQGIPLFATDEPASIEGLNATTVLVRRVKQGVAEWYRLQLKEKIWKGLIEHSADGWNIGTVPYGFLAEKVTHPSPIKAAHGLTKTRLVIDPQRGPVVVLIFIWRTVHKLAVSTITARLNADPAAYPSPDGTGWTQNTVTGILKNPKYSGYMVFGRKRTINGKKRPVPPAEWLWSPAPSHPALIDRATWDAAQTTATARGNPRCRDAHHPARPPLPAPRPDPLPGLPAAHARHHQTQPARPPLQLLRVLPRPDQPPPGRALPRPPPRHAARGDHQPGHRRIHRRTAARPGPQGHARRRPPSRRRRPGRPPGKPGRAPP